MHSIDVKYHSTAWKHTSVTLSVSGPKMAAESYNKVSVQITDLCTVAEAWSCCDNHVLTATQTACKLSVIPSQHGV